MTTWVVALMHLVAHAVFKSSLFMVVGLLLHSTGLQDSRSIPSRVPEPRRGLGSVGVVLGFKGFWVTPLWRGTTLDPLGDRSCLMCRVSAPDSCYTSPERRTGKRREEIGGPMGRLQVSEHRVIRCYTLSAHTTCSLVTQYMQ